MNFAHLHLLLNHLPILGIPLASLFLAQGLYRRNHSSQKFSLIVLLLLSVAVIPVYLSGGQAEHVVEHLPGVAESWIEAHEDSALVSLVLTLAAGFLAAAALFFHKNEKRFRSLVWCTLALAVIATASLSYTGLLGGQVRHTEVRPTSAAPAVDHGE